MSDPAIVHPLTHALGYALLHFVWQGMVIGLSTAALLRLMHRRTANARYVVACLSLAAMAAAPVLTMIAVSASGPFGSPVQPFSTDGGMTFALAGDAVDPGASVLSLRYWFSAVERWLPTLLVLWSVGVLLLMSRLVHGWLTVERIRRGASEVTSGVLQDAIARVSSAIGLSRVVRVLRSSAVEVPAVMGWIRPTLLVPASALSGLSVAELEAVIAHELAHVRRHDYLINSVQNVVETLLFYHPAVWWVSAEIRREREYCCDDVAVSVAASAPVYARALAALEEDRHGLLAFGMSATGGDLLARIQRILGQPSRRRQPPSLALVVTSAVMLVTIVAAADRRDFRVTVPALPAHGDVLLEPAAMQSTSPAARSQASAPVPAPSRQTAESQIFALEEQYRRAKLENNTVALARLLDDGFIGTNQSGVVRDKALSLELWKTFTAASLDVNAKVRVIDGVAVVTGSQTEVNDAGTDRMLFTRVWKRGASGTWTLVSNSQFLDPGSAGPMATVAASQSSASDLDQLRRRLAALEAERRNPPARPLRAGQGGVPPPRKVVDQRPVYPQEAKDAGLTGLVVMEAIIDAEGNVTDLTVVRSAGELLDRAATDAVSGWKYEPTLLNGVPTPVVCTMTVNFTLSR